MATPTVGTPVTSTGNLSSINKTIPSVTCSGTDRLLVVIFTRETNLPAITGITYNGDSFTRLDGASIYTAEGANYLETETWYLINPDATTADVEITQSGTSLPGVSYTAIAIPVEGADQVAPALSNAVQDTGSPTSESVSVTLADAETLLLGRLSMNITTQNPTPDAGTELADLQDSASGLRTSDVSYAPGSTGSQSIGWTWTSALGRCNAVILGIEPSVSAGGSSLPVFRHHYQQQGFM